MEQTFQTSFIPKKPLAVERVVHSRPASLLLVLAIFIFLAVVLASGGLYLYKGSLAKKLEAEKIDLEKAKNRFEPSEIAKLKELDKRLNSATEILSKHVSTSPIFDALQQITLKTIRYTKFSYALGDTAGSKINVKMSGQAVGYRSVALQADIFSKNKYIVDPIFSNLSLDAKGNVIFDLAFSVDPTFINYKELIRNGAPVAAQ